MNPPTRRASAATPDAFQVDGQAWPGKPDINNTNRKPDGNNSLRLNQKWFKISPVLPKLKAVFYAQPGSAPPSQPVRDWLLGLPKSERVEIGGDIQAVQFG